MSPFFSYTPYIWPMLASGVLSAALAIYAWRHRTMPGVASFAIQEMFVALWALFTAMEIAATTAPVKSLHYKLEAAAALGALSALLYFALEHAGLGEWATRRNALFLSLVAICFIILMATNDYHHLLWTRLWFDRVVRVERGPLNLLMMVWILLLPTLATIVFLRLALRSGGMHRHQALILLVATALPLFTYFLEPAGINPIAPLDPVILIRSVSSLLYALAIFRFGMLEAAPIGRDMAVERMSCGVLVLDTQNRVVDLNPAAEEALGLTRREAIGRPAGRAMAAYPGLVRLVEHAVAANTEITLDKRGSPRYVHVRASPLMHARGFYLGRLVLLEDVTERKKAEIALRESEQIQRLILENASDGIAIYEERPERGERRLLDCNERYAQMAGRTKEELLEMGDAARVQKPLAPAPYARPRRELKEAQSEGFFSWVRPDGKENIIEYTAASFRVDGRLLTVGLDRDVTEREKAEAQMLEQQRTLAVLQERERLARELHDSLGQVFAFVNAQGQTVGRLLSRGDIATASEYVGRLVEVAREADVDIRESILGLRATLSERGLFPALDQYLAQYEARFGIHTDLIRPEAFPHAAFEPLVEVQLLRVVQEALTNVRKHAGARSVRISFALEDGWARVTVQDDGQGFDPAACSDGGDGHVGLRVMRERAEEVGGGLSLRSEPGQGTVVVVRVPLGNGAAARIPGDTETRRWGDADRGREDGGNGRPETGNTLQRANGPIHEGEAQHGTAAT